MGVQVADSKTFANGLTLENWVCSVKGTINHIEKGVSATGATIYRVRYDIHYYANLTAYNNNSSEIWVDAKTLEVPEAEISGDIWTKIYNAIKANYNACTDI